MINFYNFIHARLIKQDAEELIIPPYRQKTVTSKILLQNISAYRYLLQPHVQPGDSVLLAIPISALSVSALLAIQSIGAIPVLPPVKSDIPLLLQLIRSQKIKAVLIDEYSNTIVETAVKSAGINCLYLMSGETSKETLWEPVLVPPDQDALVSFSSGTTGNPKRIHRSHRILSAQHLLIKKKFPPIFKQRDLPIFPNVILHNLAAGITTILPAIPDFRMDQLKPENIVAQLQAQRIDTLMGNVFYFKTITAYLNANPQSFPAVKQIGIGGSPVPENLIPEFRIYFPEAAYYIIYGSSEAEPIAIRKVNVMFENPKNGYYVGKPVEELEIRIDALTAIHTIDGTVHSGEIEVRGAHVATSQQDGWHKTGDIGYLSAEKGLYLTARAGNEKAHQGIQHYQIEHLLLHHQDIIHAAAIAAAEGFDIFIQGSITSEEAWQILTDNFAPDLIKSIQFKTQIPLDHRHQSKILYHQFHEI